MNLIDTNAWLGHWSFGAVTSKNSGVTSVPRVGYRISQAFVSSFDSVFQPDPMPGNRALFKATHKKRSYRPVPVINPGTPAWEDHLDEVVKHGRVVAIRLLPHYHGYSLQSSAVRQLLHRVTDLNLKLIITARLVDERQEHPAVNIKPVPVTRITKFVEAHPTTNPLIQGYGVHELKELSKAKGSFSTDTSFAEWEETLRVVSQNIPVSRILFGSLSPLQIEQAQVDKVRLSSLPKRQREAVSLGNAKSFFKI